MKKNIVNLKYKILGIYGGGGLGREVFELAKLLNSIDEKWSEIIFIDDAKIKYNPRNLKVLSFSNIVEQYNRNSIDICIAVGEPEIRGKLYKKIVHEGLNLVTLIHPDIFIPNSTVIGKGSIICNYLSITSDVVIGENVYIHPNTCIGHDSKIGAHTVISSYVDVAGNCEIGSRTFLAINVCMKQGITIGDSSIIGMASVVYRNLPNDIIALGNPARVMKKNEKKSVFN